LAQIERKLVCAICCQFIHLHWRAIASWNPQWRLSVQGCGDLIWRKHDLKLSLKEEVIIHCQQIKTAGYQNCIFSSWRDTQIGHMCADKKHTWLLTL
jgi:hypothetical protein